MIGGVVLDASILVDYVKGAPELAAVIDDAVRHMRVIVVPAIALMEAFAHLPETDHVFLVMFTTLPVVIVPALDKDAAVAAGKIASASGVRGCDLALLHSVHVAHERGWPLLTREPGVVRDLHPDVHVVPLP
jgi:hypothetical protein